MFRLKSLKNVLGFHLLLVLMVFVLLPVSGCAAKDKEAPFINEVVLTLDTFIITATDNLGVTGYLVSSTSEQPNLTSENWSESNTIKVSVDGSYTIWVKDLAGNMTAYTDPFLIEDLESKYNQSEWAGYSSDEDFEYNAEATIFTEGLLAVLFENGSWGYIDITGQTVIEPRFSLASSFDSETKLALVKYNGKFGYINTQGVFQIEAIYDDADCFSNGIAPIAIGTLWGYIDSSGKTIVEPQFEAAYSFNPFGLARFKLGGLNGYVDREGVIVIPAQYKTSYGFQDSGITQFVNEEGLIGVIDSKNTVLISPKFKYLSLFEDGLAYALIYVEENLDPIYDNHDFYGIVNTKGEFVVKPQFNYLNRFIDGLARVRTTVTAAGGKYGFINTSGKLVIDLGVSWVYPGEMIEGLFSYKDQNNQWAFYDRNNKKVISTKIDIIEPDSPYWVKSIGDFSNGMVWFQIDNKIGYMNRNGDRVYDDQFESISDGGFLVCSFTKDGFAIVRKDGKFGVIDKTGNIVIELKYQGINFLNN